MLAKTERQASIAIRDRFEDEDEWVQYGKKLATTEWVIGWAIGAWWNAGAAYGYRVERAKECGFKLPYCHNCGWVVANVSSRDETLSFDHHRYVAPLTAEEQKKWLALANEREWSSNELRAAIKQGAAFQKTKEIELDAKKLGKFVVIYADPPWQYENPPMGGSNRSIENHYPTMTLEEICALPVGDLAHDNAVLFLWATSPKLYEFMKVLDAWGFVYRTDMVWVKDKIGMGYHVRGQHESLLIAKRGDLPPPAVDDRPSSVLNAPRLEHSAKPLEMYGIIDRMYPGVRKIELFSREKSKRKGWKVWGNQK